MPFIQIGIAGSGGMALQRISRFNRIPGVKVSAVYARNIEKIRSVCAREQIKACRRYEQLLNAAEAVVICLPNYLHADFALQALQAGRHVLVEYPLCLNRTEAEGLHKAACGNNKVLMTGNTIIHEATFRYLTSNKSRLGAIQSAASRVALYDARIAGQWYMNKKMTGPVFAGLHYHHIEYYRHLLGKVKAVAAWDESRPDKRRPGYKSLIGGTLHLEHASGSNSCIQWYLSVSGRPVLPRGLWLNGRKRTVAIIELRPGRSQVIWDNRSVEFLPRDQDEWGVAASCHDFIQAIRGNFDWRKRFEEDLKTLQIGWLAGQSAREHKILKWKYAPIRN